MEDDLALTIGTFNRIVQTQTGYNKETSQSP
jgi:hypothetical protein